MTFAHLAVSASTNVPNSAGLKSSGVVQKLSEHDQGRVAVWRRVHETASVAISPLPGFMPWLRCLFF
jgi:hypothetical protein